MKETIILFGKPACSLCKISNDILTNKKISDKYTVVRVNILSFFKDPKVVEVLGMNKFYELINTIGKKLGNEYVLLFKYDEDSGQMAHVPFRKYVVIANMSYDAIDYDQLLKDIESSRYNELITAE
ncbi:SWPV2-ORF099 [Shearwaterpox virus]|uniref:Glutaredoxin-2 n=1 Tax=Shearwaterpox virus TaxID=1974596 RepID=A0A1V0QG69_CNPV|nr:SWPV2-ORF099 [Shearwaterpox virus]QGM48735.1 putative glutaredoxin 2 [Magpiepox virus]QRM15379.1 putative glutaredoxin 2, virion morphogenesis [Mudlarkpox virus]QRM15737.1 putative glutaredoxin 2 virion morphogenesis [Penguinpox virus 2]QRM16069.1 putative glutaredoxin 2 virion morphogenesis [Albatrosspox virus]QZW33405.1 MPPV-111 putative glutaredoxin 2 [Magpiepox virus 2]